MTESAIYLMIKPPHAQRKACGRCRDAHGIDDSYPLDRLHGTILRLGNESDRPADEWRAIGDRLSRFEAAPFDVAFDTLDGTLLRGARGATGAAAFHRAVARHLIAGGLRVPPQGFWLHLSLAYRGPGHPRTAIAPIAWRADELMMIRSIRGVGHRTVACWTLIDPQPSLAL